MEYTWIYRCLITYIGWLCTLPSPLYAQELPVYSVCSGQGLQKLETEGYITSPGFPAEYSVSIQCTWKIVLPPSQRIRIEFRDFELDAPRYHTGCHDMLRIIDGDDIELHRLCGDMRHIGDKKLLFINDHRVTIQFRTYHETTPGRGFRLHYSPMPCPPVPLSLGSVLKTLDNVSSEVACESGVREPIECIDGRWQPDLHLLGHRCVAITPAPAVTRLNLTIKQKAAEIPEDSNNDNTGLIVGAVLGAICFMVIIAVVILLFILRKRKFQKRNRSNVNEKYIGESKPLARPDVITIVPNYSDPVEGDYTEPVEESPPPYRKESAVKSHVKSTKSSTKSHHSYDLPYQAKSLDIEKPDKPSNQNFYDLPNSPSKDPLKVKIDDNSSSNSGPDYPAPETPEPPPLPEPNKTPSKVKIPPPLPMTAPRKTKPSRPSSTYDDPNKPRPPLPTTAPRPIKPRPKSNVMTNSTTSPYDDDPVPYACVDIISAENPTPIVRKESPALPTEDPPSVSSFKTAPHTRKL